MSDNLKNRGAQDRRRIALQEPHEMRYWADALGVSKEALQRAVEKVGDNAAAVRKELNK